jgi:hypothetical protein
MTAKFEFLPRSYQMGCSARAQRWVALAVCVLFIGLGSRAQAQELPKYEVTGFRDARFGMTEPEVRAAIKKSFALKDADIKTSSNPTEATLLIARVESLDPGPGPADITYIFGNKSKRLIQVNVAWGEDAPNKPSGANALVAAGTRLVRYFLEFSWRKDTARVGIPVGENTVVLFAGEDEKKGVVRLVFDGIKYQMNREAYQTPSADPKGPPKLVINYIADRDNPDVAKIEPGKF